MNHLSAVAQTSSLFWTTKSRRVKEHLTDQIDQMLPGAPLPLSSVFDLHAALVMWGFTRGCHRCGYWDCSTAASWAALLGGFLLLMHNCLPVTALNDHFEFFFYPFCHICRIFWASVHEETFGFNIESQITIQTRVETLVPHLRLVGLTQHRHAGYPEHNILTSVFGCPKTRHKAPQKGSGCPLWKDTLIYFVLRFTSNTPQLIK